MKNIHLREKSAADIDGQVAKILNDLGNPPPPLQLDHVRELLRLDRQYYSSGEDGVVRELVHKLTLAGKQLVDRPSRIIDVIRKFDLKALYLPDRKRILLDTALPVIKQRWGEAHEIGHDIVPWHKTFTLGDDKRTLTPACHQKLEAEANFAASRLLFLRDQFDARLADHRPCIATVDRLAADFGNSRATTLWRTVESLGLPAVGLISQHPKRPDDAFDPMNPCKYFVRSPDFTRRFSRVTELELFAHVFGYCNENRRGPLGEGEVVLRDDAGAEHLFLFETFHYHYDSLTLGVFLATRPSIVSMN